MRNLVYLHQVPCNLEIEVNGKIQISWVYRNQCGNQIDLFYSFCKLVVHRGLQGNAASLSFG